MRRWNWRWSTPFYRRRSAKYLKDELQPRHQYWCLGAINATFVFRMQNVLAVCERRYHSLLPIAYFDERPGVLHAQAVEPLPSVPAHPMMSS